MFRNLTKRVVSFEQPGPDGQSENVNTNTVDSRYLEIKGTH